MTAGVTFTIEGSGFGTEVCQMSVTLGDAECDVSSTTETQVVCQLQNQPELVALKQDQFLRVTTNNM